MVDQVVVTDKEMVRLPLLREHQDKVLVVVNLQTMLRVTYQEEEVAEVVLGPLVQRPQQVLEQQAVSE
tara:strand:+ start:86 stop:289 length:204 start_codon:yes stop_codon:yes gene_type:complete